MRSYKVKDKTYHVYDLESELPEDIAVAPDWKNARVGDWVRADDDSYIQVLERKKIGSTKVVQTCIGVYSIAGTMDTAERANRHSLSGEYSYNNLKTRKKPTEREKLFARRVALKQDPVDAYMEVYPAKSRNYAKKRAAILLKTQRMDVLMDKNKEDVMGKLEIDLYYLLKQAKHEVDNGKNGSDRISALKMLWDAWGVVEKQKVTEIGVFQGFEPKQIQEVKRPALPEYESHSDDSL